MTRSDPTPQSTQTGRAAVEVFDRLDQHLREGDPFPVALRHAVGVNDRGETEQ